MKKQILAIAIFVLLAAAISMGDLVGYWAFEDGSGTTAADSSGNVQTAKFFSADSVNYPQWIAGQVGSGALQFNNGATGYANSNNLVVDANTLALMDPNFPCLSNLGEAFTISMWVRRDVVPGNWAYLMYTNAYDVELAKNPDATNTDAHDCFWSDLSSSWHFYMGVETIAQKTLGNWYHLAMVCDNQTIKRYVNGQLEYTSYVSPDAEFPLATTEFFIGNNGSGGNGYFVGALDDVAVWAGKYLAAEEVAKLAAKTATPLTVVESDPEEPLPPFVMETDLYTGGWSALWSTGFNWDMSVTNNQVVYNQWWIFPYPGSQQAIVPNKWYVKNEADYSNATEDVTKYGVEWIDQSWNGRDASMAVIAAYITPGLVLGQKDWGYATSLPYFRTNIRVAAENSNGASARVTVYTLSSDTEPNATNYSTLMTYLGEIVCPLDAGDHVWQHYEFVLPKPSPSARLWFEMAIVGGTVDTVLYVDNFRSVSDVPVSFKAADLSEDSYIDLDDFDLLAGDWLDSAGTTLVDPRSGGLLANGDFSADIAEVLVAGGVVTPGSSKVMNPSGWTFSGIGNYGIWNTSQLGRTSWYYTFANWQPAAGDVSAYTTDMFVGDPNGVLSQTASETVVAGQTYYAMGYVMTHKYNSNNDLGEWYGWRDTATIEITVDGVVKATASRRLSRSIWRALYTSYTAVPADAGKPISIRFSYDNTYTGAYSQAGNLNVGSAYLGTTMPTEWPEKRANLLANGGFEDLSAVQSYNSTYADALRASDNTGAWFVSGIPALFPNWIYEVPTGYDLNNQGGIRSSAYYGTPIPTPGLNDIVAYGSGTFVLGQIAGALTPGTTYYLDTACGVLVDPSLWGGATYAWPSPAPILHVELWRIPVGVTDPATIHTGVITPLSGYVKLASADVTSTGDVKKTPYKWQIIGTSYTATSSDTNVYVRIYGTNPITYTYPSFAFSDVYLSTQKRLVVSSTPSSSLVVNVSSGMPYDALGAYDCYQAGLMGFTSPTNDINGDCRINLNDFAIMAEQWLEIGIEL